MLVNCCSNLPLQNRRINRCSYLHSSKQVFFAELDTINIEQDSQNPKNNANYLE